MLYQRTLALSGRHAASDIEIASADPDDYGYYLGDSLDPLVADEGLLPEPLLGPVCW
jgi:hypothetical protein